MPINIQESIKNLEKPLEWLAFIENEEALAIFTHFITQKNAECLYLQPSDLSLLPTWLKEGIKPKFIIIEISKLDLTADLTPLMEKIPKDLQVIALGTSNETSYYRQLQKIGIQEYLLFPLSDSLLDHIYKKLTLFEITSVKQNCIGVIGARGGVGVTTLTTNLAYLWATITHEPCCILDLDPQCGDLSVQLNLQENTGLHEALSNIERFDDALLKSFMTEKYQNLYVVTNDWASTGAFSALSLSETTFTNLFQFLFQRVNTLFLDLSSVNDLSLLNMLSQSFTHLVLITDLSLSSIRDTLHRFSWLQTHHPDLSPIIMVNTPRPFPDMKMAYDNLKKCLNYEIQKILPYCQDMQKATIEGEIYAKLYPEKPFTQLLRTIIMRITSLSPEQEGAQNLWQKLLSRLR